MIAKIARAASTWNARSKRGQGLRRHDGRLSTRLALAAGCAGGGALVRGISDLVSNETGILTHVAEDPLLCVVNGCGRVLEDFKRLGRVLDASEFSRLAN